MKVFEHLQGLFSSKFHELSAFFHLVELEAHLAGLSLLPFLLSSSLLIVTLLTLWLALMVLVGIGIFYAVHNLWLAAGLIVLLNGIILGGILWNLVRHLQHMSFQKTRQYIGQRRQEYDEENKKRVASGH